MTIKVSQKGYILGVIEENPTTTKMDFIAENLICLESLFRLHPYDELSVDGERVLYTDFRKQYLGNIGGIYLNEDSWKLANNPSKDNAEEKKDPEDSFSQQ